jgi:hypothetical protein
MKLVFIRHVLLMGAYIAGSIPGHAQLVSFSFNGAQGSELELSPDAQPPNLSVSPMTRGAGLTPTVSVGSISSRGWSLGALDPIDYYGFSLRPEGDSILQLGSLQLSERRSGTGIRQWSVRSSLDGFTGDLASFEVPDSDATRTGQTVLLGEGFNSLVDSVEFRIYGYGAETGTGTWRIDDVQVFGTVSPVPEPREYGIMAAGALLGHAAWRRMRRRREPVSA